MQLVTKPTYSAFAAVIVLGRVGHLGRRPAKLRALAERSAVGAVTTV